MMYFSRLIRADLLIPFRHSWQLQLSEKVMQITNKQAEFDELGEQLETLKATTEAKHAQLNKELAARQNEVKNMSQIKDVSFVFVVLSPFN